MLTLQRSTLVTGGLAAGCALALAVTLSRPAHSFPDQAGPAPRWMYTTATVDAGDLEARLGEMAKNDWEVFSIEKASSYIDQGTDAKTRIVTDKYQVTSRKPAGK